MICIEKFFSWFLLLLCWPILSRADDAIRPNIIYIMADDLGYGDLGSYGQKLMRTPNIDRLASEGIRFTQAYSGGSVCVPARAVLMTGLDNGHAPARDNVPHYKTYLQQNDVTVAKILKQAGYRTGGVGKWSLGDAGTVGVPPIKVLIAGSAISIKIMPTTTMPSIWMTTNNAWKCLAIKKPAHVTATIY